jgi:hypothetical protein
MESKRIHFSQPQPQSERTKIKGTTKRCNVVSPCGQGFKCTESGYCVLEGQTMPPSSDAKLMNRLNRKLVKLILTDELTKNQAKSILRMPFFPHLIRQLLQDKTTLEEYKQSVRKEQRRIYQQRRRILQDQDQQQFFMS